MPERFSQCPPPAAIRIQTCNLRRAAPPRYCGAGTGYSPESLSAAVLLPESLAGQYTFGARPGHHERSGPVSPAAEIKAALILPTCQPSVNTKTKWLCSMACSRCVMQGRSERAGCMGAPRGSDLSGSAASFCGDQPDAGTRERKRNPVYPLQGFAQKSDADGGGGHWHCDGEYPAAAGRYMTQTTEP